MPIPKEMDIVWLRRANAAIAALENLYGTKPEIEVWHVAEECHAVSAVWEHGYRVGLRAFDSEAEAELYAKALSIGEERGVSAKTSNELAEKMCACYESVAIAGLGSADMGAWEVLAKKVMEGEWVFEVKS